MSNKKLRIHATEINNLISNLRGEIGEIITTWVLMRNIMANANRLRTNDMLKDMQNPQLVTLEIVSDKLRDETIARLSELAEDKIGQLTFRFAQEKIGGLDKDIEEYTKFIQKNRFKEKRNYDISHKELPEKWAEHKFIDIPYYTIVKCMGKALKIMKKIDRIFLGPRSHYLWIEMRKKRYSLTYPAHVSYMLLPYLKLPQHIVAKVINEEMEDGREVWVDMTVKINGVEQIIKTCGRWGAIILGQRLVILDEPFIELHEINFPKLDKN